ncbi:hypothetical protein HEFE104084_07345 [Helicobacter felis]|uniref:Uncharacterized protein n=1 Tax=Helicobacter felis (strain ATCC 49179 / CCUG 28539 / NCTC 12436 / CS1) TaxID=936155 RepID=E7AC28_HELFC|nr:putative uncharacterized protein [Helicobacter felis ATCC 49179]
MIAKDMEAYLQHKGQKFRAEIRWNLRVLWSAMKFNGEITCYHYHGNNNDNLLLLFLDDRPFFLGKIFSIGLIDDHHRTIVSTHVYLVCTKIGL